jgi:hypothetical protein
VGEVSANRSAVVPLHLAAPSVVVPRRQGWPGCRATGHHGWPRPAREAAWRAGPREGEGARALGLHAHCSTSREGQGERGLAVWERRRAKARLGA